jgi:alkanesulfonate monooxygenase SsuD/methylene tetrahydromethanopterin reductase-like flavin-dependent oxidoreductase (luciferase family)
MRYENPHYMAEDAGAADLISGGRLQLGISRGSPEQVIDGWRYFGHHLMEGEDDVGMGRRHAEEFLELLGGQGFAQQTTSDVSESARAPASRAVLRRIA